MKLHLLRHAKTNPLSPTSLDFDRELLPRGYEQINELKTFLKAHPIEPNIILCSSAMRTRQTLAEIQDLWPEASIQFIDELYLAEKEEILKLICALNSSEEILVVGHNEGLSDLVMNLAHSPMHSKLVASLAWNSPLTAVRIFQQIQGVFWRCFGCCDFFDLATYFY
jgi:phosphohistidine phosphatase